MACVSPAYDQTQAAQMLLQEGAIGDQVTQVFYKLIGTGGAWDMDGARPCWRLDASQLGGGGLIMDVGYHMLNQIDYPYGPLVNL